MQSIIIIIEPQCKHLLQRDPDRMLLSNKRRLRLYSLEHAEPSVADITDGGAGGLVGPRVRPTSRTRETLVEVYIP